MKTAKSVFMQHELGNEAFEKIEPGILCIAQTAKRTADCAAAQCSVTHVKCEYI